MRGARVAVFAAAAAALGYLLIGVPNVELVSATVALAGLLFGPWAGLMTGALSEIIFAGLNAYGLPFPPVWLAQITGMAFTGFLFGQLKRSVVSVDGKTRAGICLAGGLTVTLFFDLLTNLAFPLAMGVKLEAWWPYLVAAIPFALVHLVSNALIFALLVPVAFVRLRKIASR